MSDTYILSACRTSIGRFHGALSKLSAPELGAIAVREAVARARVSPEEIEEAVFGNVLSAGVGQAPARQAALRGGLPPAVSALTVNMVCGSGLRAAMLADLAIRGGANLVVAGGMESMSRAPWLLPRESAPLGDRKLIDSMMHDGLFCSFTDQSMGLIAENLAESAGISREQQDRFALESHLRAVAAGKSDAFAEEIVPVPARSDEIARDEGPREDTTLEKLNKLAPVFRKEGSVTAGNASMISDGAAALVLGSAAAAEKTGKRPLARILASATAGEQPQDLFIAPVAAIRSVVSRAGLKLNEIDLFEINEAFAAQMLACLQQLELSTERVNVNGGAIALGHPIGASGARVLVTLLHALKQREKRFGIAALCLGGGNAVALLVERQG